jgi:small-conductance mechanosensitive channel/CRP-like cAMP-binding protein
MNDLRVILQAIALIALTYVLLVMIGRAFRLRHGVRLGTGYHIATLALAGIFAHAITGAFGAAVIGNVCEFAGMRPDEDTLHTIARWVFRVGVIVAAFSGVGVFLAFTRRFYWELWFEARHHEGAPKFLRQIVAVAVYIAVTLILVETVLDVRIPGLLTGSGILVAVVGLAMQDMLGNLIAGAAVHMGKPYRVGDWLLLDGRHAQVVEVNWRATRLITNDRHRLEYPNNIIARMLVVNLGARGSVHAMRITVGVGYETPPNAAKAALLRATRHTEGVLAEPPPVIQLRDFGDNAVVYDIKFFLEDQAMYPEISDGIRTHVWYELHREGMRIPMPMRTLRIERPHEASQSERRAEVARLLLAQPLFSHLHGHEADRLVTGARTVLYGVGEAVVKTGESGESLFLVVSGVLRVDIPRDGVRRTVARLKAGECFGEMSLLTGEPRGADVVAESDCELVEVSRDAFAAVLAERPELMPVLGDMLARRRAEADALFAALPHGERDAEMRRRGADMLRRISDFFALR